MNFQQGIEFGKEKAKKLIKKKVGQAVKKLIIQILKKVLMKLVLLIVKAIMGAVAALVAVLGVPLAIILAIVIIIGGAMFILAPSLGLIDSDSPRTQQEVRSELETLITNSSKDPAYRPPFELVSSIDMMRIIQEDLEPWEVEFSPIVNTLSPDLTYEDFEDTYEIKTVTTTTREITRPISNSELYIEGAGTAQVIDSGTEQVTETITEVNTNVTEQKEKVTLLKTAHAWNRLETFEYKETALNNPFKLVEVKEVGNKKIEVYKRKTKEWVFDGKDFEYNYSKFDQILNELDLEEAAIKLLVEALKENNVPLDGYMGNFFDVFIDGGMGMMVPQEYMKFYKAAEAKYKVGWNYLAAIHWVETKFSTIDIMVSSVGAIGHTQFMPCTFVGWAHPSCGGVGKGNIPDKELKDPAVIKKYGGYGVDANNDGKSDPWDLEDALFSTAHYLSKSGFSSNVKKAIRNYNHSDKYVADVLHYAELFTSTQGEIPPVSSGTFTRPASGPITSDFGKRSGGMHYGVDIGKRANVVPIVAAADGTVSRSYYSSTYGEAVFIQHVIDGQKWETVYAHMVSGSRRVQVGEQVKKGQTIGIMGNTGESYGAHHHFEIHKNGGWNAQKSNAISPTKSGLIQW